MEKEVERGEAMNETLIEKSGGGCTTQLQESVTVYHLNYQTWEVDEIKAVALGGDRVRLPSGLIAYYGQTVFGTHHGATRQLVKDIMDKIDFFKQRLEVVSKG